MSPYANEDWYTERHSWQWISTVSRVNSLVRKVGSLHFQVDYADAEATRPSFSFTSRSPHWPHSLARLCSLTAR